MSLCPYYCDCDSCEHGRPLCAECYSCEQKAYQEARMRREQKEHEDSVRRQRNKMKPINHEEIPLAGRDPKDDGAEKGV